MKTFNEIVPITGYLTDHYIIESLNNGMLIEKGTGDISLVRHASYMLRLGDTVHIAHNSQQNNKSSDTFDIIRLGVDKPILLLQPGETALLYSYEYLRFPPSVIGFTVARGLLFTHPLVPENTYVDPGFSGSIYCVVTNISDRIAELKYGMPIARLFFYKLAEPVDTPYKTGAGVGIQQYLETHSLLDIARDDVEKESLGTLLRTMKKVPITGNYLLEEIFTRLHKRIEILFWAVAIWPPILIYINNNPWIKQNFNSITTNIVASIAASGITWFFLTIWGKVKSK